MLLCGTDCTGGIKHRSRQRPELVYGTALAGSDRSWYTEQRSSRRDDSCSASQGIFRTYGTPRFIIPGSQETGSCPFPEPDELNPPRVIHPVSLCSSFYAWIFQVIPLFRNGLCLHNVAAELLNDVNFK
jgi:hypothetical protein